jgi:hypothetical protein
VDRGVVGVDAPLDVEAPVGGAARSCSVHLHLGH